MDQVILLSEWFLAERFSLAPQPFRASRMDAAPARFGRRDQRNTPDQSATGLA
jgi:hypothetical protein